MEWNCGVTTVPSRRHTTLPGTLESLHRAGFTDLRLFVDGEQDAPAWECLGHEYTLRYPPVHAFGNFWLGLLEMYLRDPLADLFSVFQDDVLLCRNTRQYFEESPKPDLYPTLAYFNLFTCRPNEDLVAGRGTGWHLSNQLGWGGQALVFPRETMIRMFQARHLVERPLGMRNGVPCPEKAWRNLDGGVIASVKSVGGVELVHYPSLTLHVDCPSVIGNGKDGRTAQGEWLGEHFDAMSWLGPQSESKRELVGEVAK